MFQDMYPGSRDRDSEIPIQGKQEKKNYNIINAAEGHCIDAISAGM